MSISILQTTSGSSVFSTTCTTSAFPNALTAGSTIIVGVIGGGNASNETTQAVHDNASPQNSYTYRTNQQQNDSSPTASDVDVEVWDYYNPSLTTTGYTITASVVLSKQMIVCAIEVSGLATSGAYDQSGNITATNVTSGLGVTATTLGVTSRASELAIAIVGSAFSSTGSTWANNSIGYTDQFIASNLNIGSSIHAFTSAQLSTKVLSSTGTQSCAFKTSGDQYATVAVIVTYEAPSNVNLTPALTDNINTGTYTTSVSRATTATRTVTDTHALGLDTPLRNAQNFLRSALDTFLLGLDTPNRLTSAARTILDIYSLGTTPITKAAQTLLRTGTDSLALGLDTIPKTAQSLLRTNQDTVSLGIDTPFKQQSSSRTLTDAFALGVDTITRGTLNFIRTFSDTLTLGSTLIKGAQSLVRSLTDALTLGTTTITWSAGHIVRTVTDSLAIGSDVLLHALNIVAIVTDFLALGPDSFTWSAGNVIRTLIDAHALVSDGLSRLQAASRLVTDTLALGADALTRLLTLNVSYSENEPLTDTEDEVYSAIRDTFNETISTIDSLGGVIHGWVDNLPETISTMDQSLARAVSYGRAFIESPVTTDSVDRLGQFTRDTLSDSITLLDSIVSGYVFSRPMNNENVPTADQTPHETQTLGREATEFTPVSDTLDRIGMMVRNPLENITSSDTLTKGFVRISTIATEAVVLTDSLFSSRGIIRSFNESIVTSGAMQNIRVLIRSQLENIVTVGSLLSGRNLSTIVINEILPRLIDYPLSFIGRVTDAIFNLFSDAVSVVRQIHWNLLVSELLPGTSDSPNPKYHFTRTITTQPRSIVQPIVTNGIALGNSPPPLLLADAAEDRNGLFTFGSGVAPTTGITASIRFYLPQSYTTVLISQLNIATSLLNLSVVNSTTHGFDLSCGNAPSPVQPNSTYSIQWQLV